MVENDFSFDEGSEDSGFVEGLDDAKRVLRKVVIPNPRRDIKDRCRSLKDRYKELVEGYFPDPNLSRSVECLLRDCINFLDELVILVDRTMGNAYEQLFAKQVESGVDAGVIGEEVQKRLNEIGLSLIDKVKDLDYESSVRKDERKRVLREAGDFLKVRDDYFSELNAKRLFDRDFKLDRDKQFVRDRFLAEELKASKEIEERILDNAVTVYENVVRRIDNFERESAQDVPLEFNSEYHGLLRERDSLKRLIGSMLHDGGVDNNVEMDNSVVSFSGQDSVKAEVLDDIFKKHGLKSLGESTVGQVSDNVVPESNPDVVDKSKSVVEDKGGLVKGKGGEKISKVGKEKEGIGESAVDRFKVFLEKKELEKKKMAEEIRLWEEAKKKEEEEENRGDKEKEVGINLLDDDSFDSIVLDDDNIVSGLGEDFDGVKVTREKGFGELADEVEEEDEEV